MASTRTRLALAAAVTALLLLAPGAAFAQACCASALGSSGLRLRPFDFAAVQLNTGGDYQLGVWDDARTFISDPDSDSVNETTALLAAIRPLPMLPHLELAVSVPFQVGYRAAAGLSEWGNGLGDIAGSARYTIFEPGNYPGLSVVVGGAVPTGRDAANSRSTLASDVTGGGTFRYGGEVWADYTRHDYFLTANAGLSIRPFNAVQGGGEAFDLSGALVGGWVFHEKLVVGANLTAIGTPSRPSRFGQVPTQFRPSGALLASYVLNEHVVFTGSVGTDLPFSGAGKNDLSFVRTLLGVRYAFPQDPF